MKAKHKGLTYIGGAFLMGIGSTHIDWTNKFVIVFCMGVLAMVLIMVATVMSSAKKGGESDGG